MRVLLLGATGFVGSVLVARLTRDRHGCVTMSRGMAPLSIKHFRRDIGRMTDEEDWTGVLKSVDAVVNAAGALQGAALQGVHVTGVAALYKACAARGVRRVIHLSAVGVDRESPSEFSASKRDGERALTGLDLDWVILRPSVVIGRAAYGGKPWCLTNGDGGPGGEFRTALESRAEIATLIRSGKPVLRR